MPGAPDRERTHDRLAELARSGLDVESFWRESEALLAPSLDFDWRACWFTLDPSSLVMTSHFNQDVERLDDEVLDNEYVEDDFNKMADLAAGGVTVTTLARATDGELDRSRRHRDLLSAYDLDHELVALLASGDTVWGAMTLYRGCGRPDFSDDDLAFVTLVAPTLAAGARRGLLVEPGDETDDPGPAAPAVLVVDSTGDVVSASVSAEHWLGAPGGTPDRLPPSVRALAGAAGRPEGEEQTLRLRTRTGGWAFVHAVGLSGSSGEVAVVIEPASPERLGPLLMAAHGLSTREQEVTQRLLRGASTKEIAEELHLSPHTIQDHLKSIFDKTGVRSRRQLLARVFFDHYEPRVRDNETRVLDHRPIRGGPWAHPEHSSAKV